MSERTGFERVSRTGFRVDLWARMLSWGEEILGSGSLVTLRFGSRTEALVKSYREAVGGNAG